MQICKCANELQRLIAFTTSAHLHIRISAHLHVLDFGTYKDLFTVNCHWPLQEGIFLQYQPAVVFLRQRLFMQAHRAELLAAAAEQCFITPGQFGHLIQLFGRYLFRFDVLQHKSLFLYPGIGNDLLTGAATR